MANIPRLRSPLSICDKMLLCILPNFNSLKRVVLPWIIVICVNDCRNDNDWGFCGRFIKTWISGTKNELVSPSLLHCLWLNQPSLILHFLQWVLISTDTPTKSWRMRKRLGLCLISFCQSCLFLYLSSLWYTVSSRRCRCSHLRANIASSFRIVKSPLCNDVVYDVFKYYGTHFGSLNL